MPDDHRFVCHARPVLTTVRQQLRSRQLAGDARAGRWTRSRNRSRHWRFLRLQWRLLTVVSLMAVAAVVGVAVLVHSAFLRGLLIGSAATAMASGVIVLMMQVSGTAAASMGVTAEQWTASELRPLRKAGWRLLNQVALQRWDIDHVLVGPVGVVAVETKWSADGWVLDPPSPRLLKAVDQVRRNARDLRNWHPLRSQGVGSVSAVVFLWGGQGGAAAKPDAPCTIGDVEVVFGLKAARAWRAAVQGRPATFDAGQVQRLSAVLDDHIRRRDEHDAAVEPVPPSVERIVSTGVAMLVTAVLSFLGCLQLPGVVSSWLWWAGVMVLGGLGLAAWRVRALRWITAAWLTGVGAAAGCGAGLLFYAFW